jgi:hypothetical protein
MTIAPKIYRLLVKYKERLERSYSEDAILEINSRIADIQEKEALPETHYDMV